jgi:hypothetical protein
MGEEEMMTGSRAFSASAGEACNTEKRPQKVTAARILGELEIGLPNVERVRRRGIGSSLAPANHQITS